MLQRKSPQPRRGVIVVLVALLLVGLLGMTAIAVDGGMLQHNKRAVQAAADAAALAGATELFKNYPAIAASYGTVTDPGGKAAAAAFASATTNGFPNNTTAQVVVNVPPKAGPFTGKAGYIEVV